MNNSPSYSLSEFVAEALPPDGFEQWYVCENQVNPLRCPAVQPWTAWWAMLNTWMLAHDPQPALCA